MNIETVRSTPNIKQKFVLVRVLHADKEVLILWGNPDIQWHKEIVEEIMDAGYEVLETLGGGWMLPKSEEEVVYVWGRSDRFGVAPIDLIRKVLKTKVIEREPVLGTD